MKTLKPLRPDTGNRMMRWFEYEHLPADLQKVSKLMADIAGRLDTKLPESAEKTAGLRKLLEAKDCFVRAEIEARDKAAAQVVDDDDA